MPLLLYATNDRGSSVVCFVISNCRYFLFNLYHTGLDNFDGECTEPVSLCSHNEACENLSAFWIELRHAKFSPGLKHVEAGEDCCQLWGGVRHLAR